MLGQIKGRIRSYVALGFLIGVLVISAPVGWLVFRLTGSLPQLDGRVILEGLSAPVTVERDNLGVPAVRGQNRLDLARATGFLHVQERFFQMDLLRRSAAGELAELFGSAALNADLNVRVHRFRSRARTILASLPSQDRQLIDAYAAGVNAGLDALKSPSFEYLLLGEAPVAWRAEDTLLAIYAMYLDLQENQWPRESTLGLLYELLPPALYRFLAPEGTEWDAPLQGEPFATLPIPGSESIDLRARPPSVVQNTDDEVLSERPVASGSNNWAVAGAHTVHGKGVLANDMHLALRVPNIWYRVSLVYPDEQGRERQVTGVTLPGTPAVVAGSNGRVAWGFTNSEGDWADLVVLESALEDSYRSPEGPRGFERHLETIRVKDDEDHHLEVLETVWGPVIDRDYRGRRRALRWVAHDAEAVNLELIRLETAATVEAALDIANRTGMPAQNLVAADAEGHIGWTIAGPIPRRRGQAGRLPRSWTDGEQGWDGWLAPQAYPRIVDPPRGRIWTANNRLIGGEALTKLGNGGYALGARARQIRDDLLNIERADEADMLAVQLDDRALFLQRWRDLLLRVLTPEAVAADPRRRELRRYVAGWSGRAGIGAVGYRMVRTFRTFVAQRVFGPLLAACEAADPRFDYGWIRQYEGPLWRLLEQQPMHLLDPAYVTWQDLFLAAVDAMLDRFLRDGSGLAEHSWGEYNTSRIRHPFSRSIPWLGYWLDMPRIPLPGDVNMPRVQGPAEGASERLVVAPGRETGGIFHMPAGQSGHPLSPHYRDGHGAWVNGEPTPFLPGPAVYRLRLVPLHRAP